MTPIKQEVVILAPTERAEQIVNRAGERLGRLAGQAVLRFQQTAHTLHTEADDMDALEPTSAQSASPKAPARATQAHPPADERAEELVDQLGQRVRHWAIVSDLQARRTLARLREDAEDIWVEAHGVRGSWKQKR